jgi:hypothetical protein
MKARGRKMRSKIQKGGDVRENDTKKKHNDKGKGNNKVELKVFSHMLLLEMFIMRDTKKFRSNVYL